MFDQSFVNAKYEGGPVLNIILGANLGSPEQRLGYSDCESNLAGGRGCARFCFDWVEHIDREDVRAINSL